MRKSTTIIVFFVCAVFLGSAAVAGLGSGGQERSTERTSEEDSLEQDGVEVPTWTIGSSWSYENRLWQNDTEEEEYVYIEEEFTYTVESVEYIESEGETYYGYNVSLEGDIQDGYVESSGMTTDIDDGIVEGYKFYRMSDLAVVEDRQYRYFEGTAMGMGVEVWLYINNSYDPALEECNFPIDTEDKFWSETTMRNWGYRYVETPVIPDEEEDWDDYISLEGEGSIPSIDNLELPGDEFDAYAIEAVANEGDFGTLDRWFAPEIDGFVKEDVNIELADWKRELTGHNIIESPNDLSIEPPEAEIGEEISLSGEIPDHPNEEITIHIPTGAEPEDEWTTETDEEGRFEETILVPVAEDMTETAEDFSSVGLVAEVADDGIDEYAVATLVIHHDNTPVFPEPEDGSEDVNVNPELKVLTAHREGKEMDVAFYDADDNDLIGSEEDVPSGNYAETTWEDLELGSTYEWYAEADDGEETFESEVWSFTTEKDETAYFEVDIISPEDEEEFIEGEEILIEYEVENTGLEEDTQDIELTIYEDEEGLVFEDSETVDNLSPESVYEGEFEWSTEDGDAGDYEVSLISEDDEDRSFVSVIEDDEKEEYDLEINAEEGGTTDPEPGVHTYEEGEDVTIEAIPDQGWSFLEWTGDHTGMEEEITITMDDDTEITAHFEEDDIVEYGLTIDIEGEGSTDPEEGTHNYEEGEDVTVTATAEEGWNFVEWTGDYEGTEEEITITMDDDKSVTAVFEEDIVEHELTIDVEGEGSTDPEEGTHIYEEGTEVTVTATAEEGWDFVEWTGDVSGTEEEITVTMDSDKEITAHFEEEDDELEAEFRVSDFDIDVDELEISITADVENIGEAEGSIELIIAGDEIESFALGPGENETIDHTYEFDEEGEYTVELGDESEVVTVEEDDDSPGFTSTLLLLAAVVAIAVYYKKKR